MKKFSLLLCLFSLAFSFPGRADFNHIQFEKIENYKKVESKISFLKANENYFRHFSPEWNYPVSKPDIIQKLKESFDLFNALPNQDQNPELLLLLGDISSYLYNLSEETYFQKSAQFFSLVLEKFPDDYRGYWFFGADLSNTRLIVKSVDLFLKAASLSPTEKPSQFWDDYAFSTHLANMPSHCNYALDQAKKANPDWDIKRENYSTALRFQFLEAKVDTNYSKSDIWLGEFTEQKKLASILNRTLGLKILVDSSWKFTVTDYTNRVAAAIVNPPRITGKGNNILYTYVIMGKVAREGDKLEDFMKNFMTKDPIQKKLAYNSHIKNLVAYELLNKDRYPTIGGGHTVLLGFERDTPFYPGLALESSNSLPINSSNQAQFFKFNPVKTRFTGKIFYIVLLDTCEDIFQDSFSNFRSMVENNILVD